MSTPVAPERRYSLVPDEVAPMVFRCVTCERPIGAGYPFVPLPRDISRADYAVDGEQVSDVLCVYCDQFPRLE